MFIIFGTSNKKAVLARGRFHCPNCRAETSYEHIEERPHFSLFFIPLIPLGKGADYVRCTSCNSLYESGVLDR